MKADLGGALADHLDRDAVLAQRGDGVDDGMVVALEAEAHRREDGEVVGDVHQVRPEPLFDGAAQVALAPPGPAVDPFAEGEYFPVLKVLPVYPPAAAAEGLERITRARDALKGLA